MDFDSPQLAASINKLQRAIAAGLADHFQKQALYEERHQKWGAAARNWLRVCEGRPKDAECARRAAKALLEDGKDLKGACRYAKRAVELAPDDYYNYKVLGHCYVAAGMHENARRALEAAQRLGGEKPKRLGLLERF